MSRAPASPEHEMNPQPALLHSFTSLQSSQKSRFLWLFAWGYFLEKAWSVACKKLSSWRALYITAWGRNSKMTNERGSKNKRKKEPYFQTPSLPHTLKPWNGARSCLLWARTGAASLWPHWTILPASPASTISAQRTIHSSRVSWWALYKELTI